MNKLSLRLSLFSMALGLLASSAMAENVPKGALVVRYGAANTDDNYMNQQGYPGVLQAVSALCTDSAQAVTAENVKELIKTDKKHPKTLSKAGAANASTLIKQGATVVKNALPGNPYHCLINNITLKSIKGVWQMFANPLN